MTTTTTTKVRAIITALYGKAPRSVRREYGGSINDCFVVQLPDDDACNEVFVKLNDDEQVLRAEAAGLQALHATKTVRVPAVLHVGALGNSAYLVLEFLPMRGHGSWSALGSALAALHTARPPAPTPGADASLDDASFGFDSDNFIGLTPQRNAWQHSWIAFYRCRLQSQLERLVERGVCGESDAPFVRRVQCVVDRLEQFFDPHEKIVPSLLHGDLWQGNWGFLQLDGTPVVFDPAAFVGHHEAELAMMTLFGDPPQRFFDAYFAVVPKAPRFEQRVPLYQLYHALNHMNLFGRGYKHLCEDLLHRLIQ
ncbi:hypothetical protein PINS_up018342 [Pythium insidiosum]|nr:hypothetical protein PINS_up018342 [Pythium insidiosum]